MKYSHFYSYVKPYILKAMKSSFKFYLRTNVSLKLQKKKFYRRFLPHYSIDIERKAMRALIPCCISIRSMRGKLSTSIFSFSSVKKKYIRKRKRSMTVCNRF